MALRRRRSSFNIIKELSEYLIPELRTAWNKAIYDIRSRIILKDLEKQIRLGDLEKAFRTLGIDAAALRPITAAIEQGYERGGVAVGGTFPSVLNTPAGRTVFRFDVRNSRSELWLRERSSTFVTRIADDTRAVVRNIVSDAVAAGRNPLNTALDIAGRVNPTTKRREGGALGLTENQERWVANARRDLEELSERYFTRERRDARFDSIVRKAIETDTPLSQEKINQLLGKYRDNLLVYRGETIARTESIGALARSEWEAYKQAVDSGAVNNSGLTKEWDATMDEHTRYTHKQMDGQAVGLDQPFTSPYGSQLMFPGDASLGASADEIIACRCRVKYNVDWLQGIE